MISRAGQVLEPPPSLGANHHKELRLLRETDGFIAKLDRVRKNGLSDLDGPLSKSNVQLVEDMRKRYNKTPPKSLQLWSGEHVVENKNGEKQVVGKKAVQKKPTSRCGKSNSQYASSEIAALHERMNECDRLRQEQREMHQALLNEQREMHHSLLNEQRAQLEEMRAQIGENRKLIADMPRQIQLMPQAVRDKFGSLFTPSQADPQADGGGDSAAAL